MGSFLNQNSLFLAWGMLQVVLLVIFLRKGTSRKNVSRLAVFSLILAAGIWGLRPVERSGSEIAEIESQIGQGVPVLIEFKSPN